MRRIRVAHCLETVHSGGVEQTRLSLARGLGPDRFEQILICTRATGVLPAQFEAAGCPVHEIGKFRSRVDWRAIRRARAILKDFNPDIVHGGVYEGVIVAAIAGRLARCPAVIGEETSDAHGRRPSGHLFFRALAALCNRVVAVSPFVRDYLVQRLRIPARKVVLIDNGVPEVAPPPAKQVEELRRALDIPQDAIVAGTVGRLSDDHKRVSDAIRALAAQNLSRLHLLIVGGGPDEAMLRGLGEELGVGSRLRFAGYQGDPRPFFALMDMFVQPSAYEAFGLTLVEAMFASLPVIATRAGGMPSIVRDGETGLLVDRYAPDQIARAMGELARDPSRRDRMGRAGLARAREHYSVERYVGDVAQLYESLLPR